MALPKTLAKFVNQEVEIYLNDRSETGLAGTVTDVTDNGVVIVYESRRNEYSQFVPFAAIAQMYTYNKVEGTEEEETEEEEETLKKKKVGAKAAAAEEEEEEAEEEAEEAEEEEETPAPKKKPGSAKKKAAAAEDDD